MIRVLVVDDSAVVRESLSTVLNQAAGIEVIGTASDPYFARDKVKKLSPDVITLDIEMPRMDGITFLKKLMSYRPIPVVMVSSLTERGARVTLEALRIGAVDFVTKPASGGAGIREMGEEIVEKVRAAAGVDVRKRQVPREGAVEQKVLIDEVLSRTSFPPSKIIAPLICIGASTGGTVAIEELVRVLPETTPGIVVVQHMPAGYTRTFAERLNTVSRMEIVEAEPDMAVKTGRVIIAQGGHHLMVHRRVSAYFVSIAEGPPVNRHRPSVDVLFRSAANAAGVNVLGVLLTGMGDDGARGLLDLRKSGAFTVAQDRETSVVFGMPGVAVEIGAAERVSPLDKIPGIILGHQKRFG